MSKIIVFNCNNAVHSTAASSVQVRDGGTVLFGGTLSSDSPITASASFKKMRGYGAKIPATTVSPGRMKKPLSGGEYAHVMATGSFQVRGMQIDLAGQTTTGLRLNQGSDYAGRRSIHASSGDRRYNNLYWTTSGTNFSGGLAGARMEFRADHETPPHLNLTSNFGEFVEMETGKVPTQKDYPTRTE